MFLGNSCYILCSIECRHFYETSVEAPTEVIAPHQKILAGEYEHDYSKNNTNKPQKKSENGESGVENSAEDSVLEGAMDNENPNNNSVVLMTSIEHALNNCALDDIHARLGYPTTITTLSTLASVDYLLHESVMVRFKGLGEIPNFGIRLHKASQTVKSLLYKLITDIMVYQERLLKKSKADDSNTGEFYMFIICFCPLLGCNRSLGR